MSLILRRSRIPSGKAQRLDLVEEQDSATVTLVDSQYTHRLLERRLPLSKVAGVITAPIGSIKIFIRLFRK